VRRAGFFAQALPGTIEMRHQLEFAAAVRAGGALHVFVLAGNILSDEIPFFSQPEEILIPFGVIPHIIDE
jgi:hypothetical protein